MTRGRPAQILELTTLERERLTAIAASGGRSRVKIRARIVLLSAEGIPGQDIAEFLALTEATVSKWRHRFSRLRLAGLTDNPRPGRPQRVSKGSVEEVILRSTDFPPAEGRPWTTRKMASIVGLSPATVARIWRGIGFRANQHFPYFSYTFLLDKISAILGLYLDSTDRAVLIAFNPDLQPLSRLTRFQNQPIRRSVSQLLMALARATQRIDVDPSLDFNHFLRDLEAIPSDHLKRCLLLDQASRVKLREMANRGGFDVRTIPTVRWWPELERLFTEAEAADTEFAHALKAAISEYLRTKSDGIFRWTRQTPKPLIRSNRR